MMQMMCCINPKCAGEQLTGILQDTGVLCDCGICNGGQVCPNFLILSPLCAFSYPKSGYKLLGLSVIAKKIATTFVRSVTDICV